MFCCGRNLKPFYPQFLIGRHVAVVNEFVCCLRCLITTNGAPACHLLYLIKGITYVLVSHKVISSGDAWMTHSLVKLEEGICRSYSGRSPGQCISWDIISTAAIDDIKTEAGISRSLSSLCVACQTCRTLISDQF